MSISTPVRANTSSITELYMFKTVIEFMFSISKQNILSLKHFNDYFYFVCPDFEKPTVVLIRLLDAISTLSSVLFSAH